MVCIGPASCGGPVRQLRTLAPLAQRPLIRGKARKIAVGTLALWPQAALAQRNPESTGSDTDDVGKIGHIDLPAAAMGGIENHFPAVQIAQAMVEPVFGSRPKRRLRPPLEGNRRGISEEEDQLLSGYLEIDPPDTGILRGKSIAVRIGNAAVSVAGSRIVESAEIGRKGNATSRSKAIEGIRAAFS